jgi:hypothetical protein
MSICKDIKENRLYEKNIPKKITVLLVEIDMDLDYIFNELKKIITKHASGLDTFDEFLNSQAKVKKDSYHLYSKERVKICGKMQKVFLAGIVKQRTYVGFYFMPIYSDRARFNLNEELKKTLHGKSCFYIKDKTLFNQVEQLLIQGKEVYKEKGWI